MKPAYLRFSIHSEDGQELNYVVLNDAILMSGEGLPQLKTPLLVKACELLLGQLKETNTYLKQKETAS